MSATESRIMSATDLRGKVLHVVTQNEPQAATPDAGTLREDPCALAALAEAARALIACETEEHVFDVVDAFFAQLVPGAIVMVNVASPDGLYLINRSILGVDESFFVKAAQLLGVAVTGSRWPIKEPTHYTDSIRALVKLPGGFRELVADSMPTAVTALAEKAFGFRDAYAIAIADQNGSFGNVCIVTTANDTPIPVHAIESFVYACLLMLSRLKSSLELTHALNDKALLFENMNEGLALHEMIFDEDGKPCDFRFLQVNSAYEKETGLLGRDIIGKTVLEVTPDFDRALIARFGTVADTGVPCTHEDYSPGLGRYLRVTAYLPKTNQFAVVVSDVTERKKAEEALRESEDKFKYVFESSVVPKSITYPTGEVRANDAFCEMLGYTHEELADRTTWMQLTHPDDVARSQRRVEELLSGTRASARFEKRYQCKDGSIVWADVSTSLRLDAAGQPLYFMTTILDITERKRTQETLVRREARLHELLEERECTLELLADSLSSTTEVLSQVAEMRDPYTAGHQRRVSELAVCICQEMGLPAKQIEEVRIAGLIHDIGKISIPAEVLSKPGKLTNAEFTLIKTHSEAGFRVLTSANMVGPTAEIVYQHHERCDGSGYPRGLHADELLGAAKIIMVADVVEAMMSHRPYRPGLGVDVALAEVERGAGTSYDTEVCQACLVVFREQGFEFSSAHGI